VRAIPLEIDDTAMAHNERRSKYEEARLTARRTVTMNVTELRIARGWSQAELARQSGLKEQDVTDVEAGTGKMFIDTLSLLPDGLTVDISRLFRNRTDSTDLCRKRAITTLDLETDQTRL
jgi:transcriptional regulator with XRE-family HTH domain